MKHIIKTQSFSRPFMEEIFSRAEIFKNGNIDASLLKGKIVGSLFYEPSTRTRLSTEAAVIKLGGNVITVESAKEFSSVSKGETLEDSIRVMSSYCDAIALRHSEGNASERAAHVSSVPVINCGSGQEQHPTQSLTDLFSIQNELGHIDGIKIAICGDLRHGRTVSSLSYLLCKYKDVEIFFVAPKKLGIPDNIRIYLNRKRIKFSEHEKFGDFIETCDVVYQTRLQKERFQNPREFENSHGRLVIDRLFMGRFNPHGIILHPLPRVEEIRFSVDDDPRAAYFRQAENGVFVRMALFCWIFGV